MSHVTSQPLATVIRRYRLAAGLSQEDLAERSELSARTISDLERGLRQTPHLETVRMIADGLGLTDAERASLIAAARPELSYEFGRARDRPNHLHRPGSRNPSPCAGHAYGRERAIADLVSMLSDGTTRLITLTGPGGVGKTRLALAVPSRGPRSAFPRWGVCRRAVPASTIQALGVATIAHHTRREEPSGEHHCSARSAPCFVTAKPLLLLDNCEQITEAARPCGRLDRRPPPIARPGHQPGSRCALRASASSRLAPTAGSPKRAAPGSPGRS